MNAADLLTTLRLGATRGWITFRSYVTSREGFTQTVFWNALPLAVLIWLRDAPLPGTTIVVSALVLPGIIAVSLAFGVMSTAYNLATEREDGTLLRAKAVPGGTSGYVVGLSVASALDAVIGIVLVMVPAMFIVPGVPVGSALLWLGLLGWTALGLLACLPLGILIGSVVRNPRTIGGLGFLATTGLAIASGLFTPLQDLWSWLQVVVPVFPVYWLGVGLRSVFLPAEAAALEIGGTWRVLEAVGVLGLWAALGLLLGPVLLRRMARRESGSAVEARRQLALQRN
ncbi:ABC transporter permease [Pseudonocardia lacus]|uniref:ABC transporter permease n=1 Tax=Pseudonocardia lacus TaxID=2835865 RepID=UPI001BDC6DEB|nr:ABC transporter permease [Pseudonocardia lacus]